MSREQQNALQQTLHDAFEKTMWESPTSEAKTEAACAWLGALVSEYVLIAAIGSGRDRDGEFLTLVLEDLNAVFSRHFPMFAGGKAGQHVMRTGHARSSR
jgi:hypothetical protein